MDESMESSDNPPQGIEILKHGGYPIVEQLTTLLNTCWATAQVPEDWQRGVIIKLPKKGHLAVCNNWRGITLLSVPGKVFCIVLLRRLREAVDKKLREEQAGFRCGRSCNDQIFILRNIIEQSLEFQQRLYINFIDFVKAFDSVDRESLWCIARDFGIPERFVNMFWNLYYKSSCCVRTETGNTDFFTIETGVRQGCILSPLLFLMVVDCVMQKAMDHPEFGIPWRGSERLTDLDFADDIALLGTIRKNIEETTKRLEQEAAKIALRISTTKTKVMRVGYTTKHALLNIGQQQIEEVDKFTYLGSIEILKHGGYPIVEQLTTLLNTCWATAQVPEDWQRGVIIKLPKKGHLAVCNNWRGITLLSVPGKVFCIVLLRRLREAVDKKLREEQAGFRCGRSCNDQIFTLWNIIEQSLEFQQRLYINFIDFVKAFDSVDRESLWCIARDFGIPERFVNMFWNLYYKSSCCVRTETGNTDFFTIKTGVRQGCILSPLLFLMAVDFVMQKAMDHPEFGIPWRGSERLTDLDFADDIALLGTIRKNIEETTKRLEQEAAKIALRISTTKTKAATPPHSMDEILQRLAEVSIRQQQIVEHLATRQGETEQELATRQRVPVPDPRVQAAQLLPKMTAHDDVEVYLQMFENTATTEGWEHDDWARALAPLLTGEAQRAFFSLPTAVATQYEEVKREILARVGLSPVCAAQYFHDWVYQLRLPARAQMLQCG
ncbi:uncharacterized protein LOC107684595 [Sinocyclocheilus anshuiensis]|uniref:uncharacterized protein LOC107684595 n=1 Tax=Sinocyclocheilus anshuiensis TaxID=1608454 RepID=UPI0007BAC345|nr:PREDICTED: uncharacterized protein LOC107684595 [Sinocyclocheilus anshuiensis]